MSKYHVKFYAYSETDWVWRIYYGEKVMAESSSYSSKINAKRGFLKVTSRKVLQEIDMGEGW